MSNPTVLAEQTPANLLAWTDGQALVATGSPFGPVDLNGKTYRIGQANNALMFPGLGLGTIVCRASVMSEPLFLAAARAIAGLTDVSDPSKGLLPGIDRLREVSATVAVDVIKAATEAGVARVEVDDPIGAVQRAMWSPAYPPIELQGDDMAQTVAEVLVDLMVEAGIQHVYGIVGDSANPIVDAMRRHAGDDRVRARAQRGGGRVRGRRRRAGLRAADGGARLVRARQPPSAQRPLRLQAQRRAGVRHRDPHPEHRDRHRLLPGDGAGADLRALLLLRRHDHLARRRCRGWPSSRCRRRSSSAASAWSSCRATSARPRSSIRCSSTRSSPSGRVIRPTDAALDRAAALIDGAEKVAIYGGEGTRDARDEVLAALADAAGAGRLRLPRQGRARARQPRGGRHDRAARLGRRDQGAGGRATCCSCSAPTSPTTRSCPSGPTIIQVDDKPSHLGRRANIALGLVGDVGETLRALLPRLERARDRRSSTTSSQAPQDAVKHLQTYVDHQGSGEGLRPEMVAAALSELAEDDAVFTVDTGMCNVWGARYLRDEARAADPRLVQPRLDGERDAAGDRREGRLARTAR